MVPPIALEPVVYPLIAFAKLPVAKPAAPSAKPAANFDPPLIVANPAFLPMPPIVRNTPDTVD